MTDRIEQLLLGDSAAMRKVRRLVSRFGPTALPVLVTGPTGAGKGLVAQALHETSRRAGRFVVANVAAFGDGVIESELFGHVRGAFTSSTGSRRGLIQHADRGTLFLDEIHRLSRTAQPKLLRVIETQFVRPVGSDNEMRVDFRIVSAANEDLEALADVGRFQGDLLARVSRLVIHVPPLVEHMEDLPLLTERFVRGLDGGEAARFTPSALAALMEYDWPRNVRELQAVVERAVILAERPLIDRTDVRDSIAVSWRQAPAVHTHPSVMPATIVRSVIDAAARRERSIIEALEASGGRVKVAATVLGVSPNTVYRWMSEFGIATPERRSSRRVSGLEILGEQDGTESVQNLTA